MLKSFIFCASVSPLLLASSNGSATFFFFGFFLCWTLLMRLSSLVSATAVLSEEKTLYVSSVWESCGQLRWRLHEKGLKSGELLFLGTVWCLPKQIVDLMLPRLFLKKRPTLSIDFAVGFIILSFVFFCLSCRSFWTIAIFISLKTKQYHSFNGM